MIHRTKKLSLSLLLTAIVAGTSSVASAATTLIHGEAGPNRGARAAALQWFADEVGKRSDGELDIDIQWGGALFKANAAVQSIGDGVADMGTVIAVYYPQEMRSYGIADLPVNNPDAWVGMRATDELMRSSDGIAQKLAEKNLVYIGTFTTSAVHIGCKDTAIRSMADIEGKKIRGTGAYGKVFSDNGGNMVSMSIYKAYQGLDTGLLDCSQGYSYAVTALKQQEVMTSYTLLNWGQVGGVGIMMNKDMFESLSPEAQQVISDTGSDMSDEFGRLITDANNAAIETMKGLDIEVIELPEAERAQLLAGGEKYLDDWVAKMTADGLDGEALLAEYLGLIEKYSQERDEQGYPWTR